MTRLALLPQASIWIVLILMGLSGLIAGAAAALVRGSRRRILFAPFTVVLFISASIAAWLLDEGAVWHPPVSAAAISGVPVTATHERLMAAEFQVGATSPRARIAHPWAAWASGRRSSPLPPASVGPAFPVLMPCIHEYAPLAPAGSSTRCRGATRLEFLRIARDAIHVDGVRVGAADSGNRRPFSQRLFRRAHG